MRRALGNSRSQPDPFHLILSETPRGLGLQPTMLPKFGWQAFGRMTAWLAKRSFSRRISKLQDSLFAKSVIKSKAGPKGEGEDWADSPPAERPHGR